VILVAGIADEAPTAAVIEALESIGAAHRVFDQRVGPLAHLVIRVADAAGGGVLDGVLTLRGEHVPLSGVRGIYLRLMDDGLLPGVADLPPDASERRHVRRLHHLLSRFADIAQARVLNRPSAMASNHSKPYQAHAIRAEGFGIPETLITNDPPEARAFVEHAWADGGHVIYKSISGMRSIVQRVEASDIARLDRIRWCPTQFQRQVDGVDIRVHVVGTTVLAAEIATDATDYRYAARQTGSEAALTSVDLDATTRAACVRLARRLDLPLAGIDLRRTGDGRLVCFEVNPSPAFTFYEQRTGQPIAAAIARYLAGEAD
jgi:glutathione synthase/RimK-type ligase-like ATP-grasp enzyme